MTSFSLAELESEGFEGFENVAQLQASNCARVPKMPGVYVVLRDAPGTPTWLPANPGGRFKGRDPSVSTDVLATNWVDKARVIYIGKADQLQRRLRQYMDFGAGKPVGHWGGRLICADEIPICYPVRPTRPAAGRLADATAA